MKGEKLTNAQRKERRAQRRKGFWDNIREQYKKSKVLFLTYFILRLIVILVMIAQFFNHDYGNVFMCAFTLVLFMIPSFVEKRIKIDVPDLLEIIVLFFIFAAEIMGEIREYYINVPHWDTLLHTTNGFLCAAIGLALIDILNRSERFSLTLSPFFVAVFAFCFSMTIGVVWEFYEYGSDMIFKTDMQKDTVIHEISSVMFNPDGRNSAVTKPIESIVVNGEEWNGYIDIGLIDTMKDLLVNFAGAAVFSMLGYFYVKSEGRGKIANKLMLRWIKTSDEPPVPAAQGADGAARDGGAAPPTANGPNGSGAN